MRIAYVCADPGVPIFGRKGCSIHVQEVVRTLGRKGHEVELFATRLGDLRPPDLAGLPAHWLPALPRGDLALRERASLGANHCLAAALRRTGPFDLVYERYSLWSHAAMEYARREGIPGVLEVNAPLIREQAVHRGLVDRERAEAVAARVFSTASTVVAVSDRVAAYVEAYPGLAGRVHVVPNGVDPDRFLAAPGHRPPGEAFTVGFIGSLKPWHGLPVLVEAFARARAVDGALRLLIVGDGPERANVESRVAELGLRDAVDFTGAVPPSAVPRLLASMDVAVAPYPRCDDFYFSPLKVFEYMAAGLPVIASRVGQIPDVLPDGTCGLLCPPGDIGALVRCIRRVRSDRRLALCLGRAARARVLERYTWDSVVERILALAEIEQAVPPLVTSEAR